MKYMYIFSAVTWVQINLSSKSPFPVTTVTRKYLKTLYPILWNEDLDFGARTCSLWRFSQYGFWFKYRVRHLGRPGVPQLRCVMVATHTLVPVHCTGTNQQYTHMCTPTQPWCGPHRENYSRVIISTQVQPVSMFLGNCVSQFSCEQVAMNESPPDVKSTSCDLVPTKTTLCSATHKEETKEVMD